MLKAYWKNWIQRDRTGWNTVSTGQEVALNRGVEKLFLKRQNLTKASVMRSQLEKSYIETVAFIRETKQHGSHTGNMLLVFVDVELVPEGDLARSQSQIKCSNDQGQVQIRSWRLEGRAGLDSRKQHIRKAPKTAKPLISSRHLPHRAHSKDTPDIMNLLQEKHYCIFFNRGVKNSSPPITRGLCLPLGVVLVFELFSFSMIALLQ